MKYMQPLSTIMAPTVSGLLKKAKKNVKKAKKEVKKNVKEAKKTVEKNVKKAKKEVKNQKNKTEKKTKKATRKMAMNTAATAVILSSGVLKSLSEPMETRSSTMKKLIENVSKDRSTAARKGWITRRKNSKKKKT